jgi:3-hydroxybutyryl-CoA dehydrogenase
MGAKNIKKVVVIGGGTMGQGIAQNFAEAGLAVQLVGRDIERLNSSLNQIDVNLKQFEQYGLLKEKQSAIKSRISLILMNDLWKTVEDSDFVVETVSENLELKRQLFQQLDSCRDEVIIGSNTSSFPIATLAEGCKTASRIIGVHYYNPAHIMPLVEIHYGPQTSEKVIATTKQLMLRVGKKPIIVKKDIPGLIGTRLQLAQAREIEQLLERDVASPEDIDTAAKASYGFRYACIGNIETYDMVGLDVMYAVEKNIYKLLSNAPGPSSLLEEKVKKGELGVKAGRGWFDYSGKSKREILDDQNRRLLKQLALFKSLEKGSD